MRSRQRWITIMAAATVTAVVVVIAAFAVIPNDSNKSDDPDGSDKTIREFDLKAVIHSRVPDVDGISAEETIELHWVYSPPSKWYTQLTSTDSQTPLKLTVSDGRYLWQYYPKYSAFCKISAEHKGVVLNIPDGMTPAFIGPSSEITLEQFMERLRSIDPSVTVTNVGADQYLSRDVRVIEYRPAAPPGSGWQGSIGRIWIDVDEMFVLRHRIEETDGQRRFYDSSVVEFKLGEPEQDRFRFEPPANATEFLPVGNNCDQGLMNRQAD